MSTPQYVFDVDPALQPFGDGDIGLPNTRSFEGPWFSQQVTLSVVIGIISFLTFTLVRKHHTALFAPRTKLKGFSPLDDGLENGPFGWIWPTINMSEIRILQVVGLDAAILLSFLKMGFWLFLFISLWSTAVLMPVNYWQNGVTDGVSPDEDNRNNNGTEPNSTITLSSYLDIFRKPPPRTEPLPHLPPPTAPPQAMLYHAVHLLSTYVFTLLALRFIWKNYQRFVRSRQLYILEILESIPARTIEIRELPEHLRDEKALAEYFEAMEMKVESTAVTRKTEGLSKLLAARSKALHALEQAWVKWLGNPTDAQGYDPERIMLLASASQHDDLPAPSERFEHGSEIPRSGSDLSGANTIWTKRKRPTMRANSWNPFSAKVDALDELTHRYVTLDKAVRETRKAHRFAGGKVGFVTFQDAASAQIASQTVHYPLPAFCRTSMAPEPRDIIWSNIDLPNYDRRIRQVLVAMFMTGLLLFYIPPLVFLASLLSPSAIHRYLPWLDKLLDADPRLRALVQNNLPSLVLIGFNALLPLILEWSAVLQGLKARSLIEYSVLKKYYIFLLVSVVFIFLITSTAWGVLQDLTENPMRVIDKFALSLPRARFFSLSYVILQGIALQPLQLLQLPTLILRAVWRLCFTRTPREFAELNAPPTLPMGTIYPQALLIFTLCILYSIVSPIITIFGAIYFGIAYVVTKYKLLYVFYKPYESQGLAWPISATRCIWALVLFLTFQFSLFSVRKQFLASILILPLLGFTIWFGQHLGDTFGPLTKHVNLSSVVEMTKDMRREGGPESEAISELAQNGPPAAVVADSTIDTGGEAGAKAVMDSSRAMLALRPSQTVDPKHTRLAKKRYSNKEDDTLFVAQRDSKTDYREPPSSSSYPGVLNTGRRRYGHPALTGILPELWLPIPAEAAEEHNVPSEQSGMDLEAGTSAATSSATVSPVAAKKRAQALSKAEPLILSLRRRKSLLLRRPSGSASASASAAESRLVSDGVSGPQGSSGQAAIGEVLSGEYSVAPVRTSTAASGSRMASTDEEGQTEEDEDEQDEGVYIHRTIRSARSLSSSQPYHD